MSSHRFSPVLQQSPTGGADSLDGVADSPTSGREEELAPPSPRHQDEEVVAPTQALPTVAGRAAAHLSYSVTPPLASRSSRDQQFELRPVALHPQQPTNLADALQQLSDAREDLARLRARLQDEQPFASRGLDHSDQRFDLSTSTTRDEHERRYEEDAHAAKLPMEDDTLGHDTCCCGCVGLNRGGESHPQMSLEEYFRTPFYFFLLKRLPWLIVLLILQSFSASILASYDGYLESHLIFSFFVPMVVGTGGNAGAQCSVMVTRALALGMDDSEVLRVVRKEAPIAVITSLSLALFAFFRVSVEYPQELTAAAAIALTLGVSILISIALGILFSYGIEKIRKCDPADGAAPLLSTISDLIGIGLLCGIATSMVD